MVIFIFILILNNNIYNRKYNKNRINMIVFVNVYFIIL